MSSGDTMPERAYFFGPFAYDINKALTLIAEDPDRAVHQVDVTPWAQSLGLDKSTEECTEKRTVRLLVGDVDEEYALTRADLSVPVIFADVTKEGEPGYLLIDGAHRMRRAYVEGREKIPAYILNRDEAARIRRRR